MIEYEVEIKIINSKKKVLGARILLRFYRVLEFIVRFMMDLKIVDDYEKMFYIIKIVYDDILVYYYFWFIRKGVYVVVYILFIRKYFLEKLKMDDVEKVKDLLVKVSDY